MGMSSGGSKNSRVAMSEINVTPLVDVMLVLLIIFMVTAPMMQQGLEVELPETASSGIEAGDEPFVIVLDKAGKVYFDKTPIAMNAVKTKIQAIFKTRKNKQVYIKADKRTYYEYVAQAMAEVRAAGITNVGLVTLPKNQL